MKRTIRGLAVAVAATMILAVGAFAAVTFDPATGTGFVGKGDVQLVYGWNNKQLQDNASTVDFRVSSESITSWTCSKPNPGNPDQPDIVNLRSSTVTTQGLVTNVARETSKGKNGPITGFNLTGYDGSTTTTTTGDALGSCPAVPSGFTHDGNEQTSGGGSSFEVTTDGTNWFPIQ
jgi:hypothetical protein